MSTRGAAILYAAALVATSCGDPSPTLRDKAVGAPRADANQHQRGGMPSTMPAPHVCPSGFAVVCDTWCCPSGTKCGNQIGCFELAVDATCPSSAPLRCAPQHVGSTARDATTHHDDLTTGGALSFGVGKFGGALDGNNGATSAPGIAMPAGNAPFTVEAFAYLDSQGSGAQVSPWRLDLGGTQIVGNTLAPNELAFDDRELSFGAPQLLMPSPPVCDVKASMAGPWTGASEKAWHHYAMTYDGQTIAFYVDGALVQSCGGIKLALQPGSDGFASGGFSCDTCTAHLDELRVLDRAESAAELATDAAATAPFTPDAHTIALWHFDDAATGCCPAGATCNPDGSCGGVAPSTFVACDAQHPVGCGTGQTCCGAGERCPDGVKTFECSVPSPPPWTGPTGPSCGAGYCDAANACASDACCPAAATLVCGASCCTPEGNEPCASDGRCPCAPGEVGCGGNCCQPGATCDGGVCRMPCSDAAFPVACGDVCCAATAGCASAATSSCGCPSEAPTPCGATCCGPGARCAAGQCVCNAGISCGDLCCAPGQACVGGVCGAGSSSSGGGGLGTCPGGIVASEASCVALGTASCSCNGLPTSACIPSGTFTGAGFPVPTSCPGAGETGCAVVGKDGNVYVAHPCCPGLTCRIGHDCGGADLVGTCE